MGDSEKYIDLWKKHLPLIWIYLKKLEKGKQKIQLNEYEFQIVGDRLKSGYTFHLDLQNGKIANDIRGSAVARDLAKVLQNNKETKCWLIENNIKFRLDNSFCLTIELALKVIE